MKPLIIPTANEVKADFTTHHIEGIAREGMTPFECPLITKVTDNLWQGGCRDGVSLAGQFKHVISLYIWEQFDPGCELDTFVQVKLMDGPVVPDPKQLFTLARLINVCRQSGNTLVHCQAGLNRSGLLTGLALVLDGMLPADAVHLMRRNRSKAVLCNQKFLNWLLEQEPGDHPRVM